MGRRIGKDLVERLRESDVELDQVLVENTPNVIEPGFEGHQLRLSGMPWPDVAKKIGSPSATAAVHLVGQYLQRAAAAQSSQHQQEALATQVDRYESVLAAWWARGVAGGDEKAAGVVLRTLERLDRILRLTDGDVVVTKETLVISADPQQYLQQLQNVVAERDGAR